MAGSCRRLATILMSSPLSPRVMQRRRVSSPATRYSQLMEWLQTAPNLWIYHYLYNVLKPRQVVNIEVQSPGEQPRQLELKAKVQTGKVVFDLTSSNDLNAYWRDLEDENSHERTSVR